MCSFYSIGSVIHAYTLRCDGVINMITTLFSLALTYDIASEWETKGAGLTKRAGLTKGRG